MTWPVSYGTRLYLIGLAGIATGLTIVAFGYWRRGLVVVGLTMVCIAVVRWLIPEDHIGALKVRSRWLDVLWMGGLGLVLTALALVVPPPVFSL